MKYVKLFESWLNEDETPSPDAKKVLDSGKISSLIDSIAERAKSIGISVGKERAAYIAANAKKKANGGWTVAGGPSVNYDKAGEIVKANMEDLYPADLAFQADANEFYSSMTAAVNQIMKAYFEKESNEGWKSVDGGKQYTPSTLTDSNLKELVSNSVGGIKKLFGDQSKFYATLYSKVPSGELPKNIAGVIKKSMPTNVAPEEPAKKTAP
jgi:hypothetical protein